MEHYPVNTARYTMFTLSILHIIPYGTLVDSASNNNGLQYGV
jgi:hypothetical protein